MICPKNFLIIWVCAFFFLKIFLVIYLLDFLGQFVNFLGRGAKYINLRVRIKILFVNIHTSIFFSKGWGGCMEPLNP